MAVVIRLQRHGRSKRPFYRIVAIDSRNRRDGRELERLGWYNPLITDDNINIKEDRINYWMENGANTSDAVHGLFKKIGFNLKRDLERQGKSEEEIEKFVSEYIKSQEEIRNKKAVTIVKGIALLKNSIASGSIASKSLIVFNPKFSTKELDIPVIGSSDFEYAPFDGDPL